MIEEANIELYSFSLSSKLSVTILILNGGVDMLKPFIAVLPFISRIELSTVNRLPAISSAYHFERFNSFINLVRRSGEISVIGVPRAILSGDGRTSISKPGPSISDIPACS